MEKYLSFDRIGLLLNLDGFQADFKISNKFLLYNETHQTSFIIFEELLNEKQKQGENNKIIEFIHI